jgi:hypothetical protein
MFENQTTQDGGKFCLEASDRSTARTISKLK